MEVQEEKTETTTAAAENTDKKRRLDINFAELFGEDHDTPEEELVVVPSKPRWRRRRKSAKSSDDEQPSSSGCGEDFSLMSEGELKITIDRIEKSLIALSGKLPDGGAKLKAKLQTYEDELKRRQQRCSQQIAANGHKKPMQSEGSSVEGTLDGSKQAVPSSESSSLFASFFLNKLDNDNPKLEQNTTNQSSNAFNREISYVNPCDKAKRPAGKLPQSKKANPGLFSKEFSAWRPGDSSPRNGGKYMQLNGKLAGTVSSTDSGSLPLLRQNSAGSSIDEDDSQALDSNGSKNKTVVLVDEEEPELIERTEEVKELPSRLSEGKIYYPSREDPESLEIYRSELKCLEPGECLTSTIMNFYVRYLQERCSDSLQSSFYFFNTYFYSKLQEAMEYQKNDQEAFFMKFRRWWKGVNIFEKAYIFLPINEDNHWSLVIICIPEKEGGSGLIILHLDSLGLHSSASIFDNIKSLLKNEWKILNDDVGSVNNPVPEKIWRPLPCRIEHKSIMVPRQTNDYDCGLFVLYYMERFMQDAPERLRKQDYSKFGKNWFKPQEASSLRKKIKGILEKKFHEALEQDKHTFEPVCLSTKAETAKAIDCAEIS